MRHSQCLRVLLGPTLLLLASSFLPSWAAAAEPAVAPLAEILALEHPPRPVLPESIAVQVAELEKRIQDLRETGLTAKTKEQQDAALSEAVDLAERVLKHRAEHQNTWTDTHGAPGEWWELTDARLRVARLRQLIALDGQSRTQLAKLAQLDVDIDRAYSLTQFD